MGQAVPVHPAAIVQDWLDHGSDLIMRGDFATWAGTAALPCIVETGRSRVVIQNVADLRSGFEAWRSTLLGNGLTEMVRTARDVAAHDDETIGATFDVNLLCRAVRVMPTFSSWILLRRTDATWRLTHLVSGLANQQYPFTVLRIDAESQARVPPAAARPGECPPKRRH